MRIEISEYMYIFSSTNYRESEVPPVHIVMPTLIVMLHLADVDKPMLFKMYTFSGQNQTTT